MSSVANGDMGAVLTDRRHQGPRLVWRSPADGRARRLMLIGLPALVLLSIGHILFGTVDLAYGDILRGLTGRATDIVHHQIVVLLRLPRVLVAILAGAMLGLAGAILQSITRNPLAEPGLMGVTAGAVFAIVAFLLFGAPVVHGEAFTGTALTLPIVGVCGGMAAASIAYLFSFSPASGSQPLRLILFGVLVSAVCGAFTALLMLGADDYYAREILFWTVGSLNGRVFVHVGTILPFALTGLAAAAFSAGIANRLQLGDGVAKGLGLAVEPSRFALIFLASWLTAGAVSVVGGIGFIGLVGPHIARMVVGNDARRLFPAAALLSALLLVAADLVARTAELGFLAAAFGLDLPGTTGLPVGAVTAGLGVPFFLYLVLRRAAKD